MDVGARIQYTRSIITRCAIITRLTDFQFHLHRLSSPAGSILFFIIPHLPGTRNHFTPSKSRTTHNHFCSFVVMSFWMNDLIASYLKFFSTTTSVPGLDDIISIILHTLDYPSLKSLCCVSQCFRAWTQPLFFRTFQSSRDLEKTLVRLQAFGNALKKQRSLYGAIRIIKITNFPHEIPDATQLACLLDPILAVARNICNLAIPVDKHTLKSLQNAVFPCLQTFQGRDFSSGSNKNTLCQLRPFMLSPALLSISLHGLYQDKAFELPGRLNLRDISFTESHLNYEAIHKLFENNPYLRSFYYTQPAIYRFRKGTHFTPAQITQALHSSRDSLERLVLSIPCDNDYDFSDDDTIASWESDEYMDTKNVDTDQYLAPLTGLSSGQYLGPLTSFSCLRYLYVDQNLLPSEAALPDCLEKLNLRLREPLRMDLLSHLARASHTLLSLKSVFFIIEDDCIDERDCRLIYSSCDIDFETVGFRERVVVESF